MRPPSGDGPHPTIFAFHGFGSNAQEVLELAAPLLDERALIIAPQAPEPAPPEIPAKHPGGCFAWFPFTLAKRPTPASLRAAEDVARAFVAEASERYAVDPARTVALGFSQGGVIAYGIALTEPERFRAIVALSSWLPDYLVRRLPQVDRAHLDAWVSHGTRDDVILASRGRDSVAKLRDLGVERITHREYDMAHEVSPASLADLDAWLRALLA